MNKMQRIQIEKDGIPFIDASESGVLFGFGERCIEYTWTEIEEIVRADYNNYIAYHITKERK